MVSTNQEIKYLHRVYRNITLLGILLHVFYTLMFGALQFQSVLIYNILDIIFYIGVMYIVTKLNQYTLVVSLIHIESMIFCALHTFIFGWEPSFFIYLIAMASLVYFCPYRATYIPYLFSVSHLAVFFCLYIYTNDNTTMIQLNDFQLKLFFVFNNIAAFIIILYVAYVSKASALVGRKELMEQNLNLQELSNYDQMTGLYNRTCLRNRYTHFQSNKNILAIGDIDDFKAVNDTYGHICGDIVLKELADQLRTKLDPNIFLCRWGGEEFVLIFQNCSIDDAKQQLQEFCKWIENYPFYYQDLIVHITITFGLSQGDQKLLLEQWIENADQLLYKGKQNGKNMVLVP